MSQPKSQPQPLYLHRTYFDQGHGPDMFGIKVGKNYDWKNESQDGLRPYISLEDHFFFKTCDLFGLKATEVRARCLEPGDEWYTLIPEHKPGRAYKKINRVIRKFDSFKLDLYRFVHPVALITVELCVIHFTLSDRQLARYSSFIEQARQEFIDSGQDDKNFCPGHDTTLWAVKNALK